MMDYECPASKPIPLRFLEEMVGLCSSLRVVHLTYKRPFSAVDAGWSIMQDLQLQIQLRPTKEMDFLLPQQVFQCFELAVNGYQEHHQYRAYRPGTMVADLERFRSGSRVHRFAYSEELPLECALVHLRQSDASTEDLYRTHHEFGLRFALGSFVDQKSPYTSRLAKVGSA